MLENCPIASRQLKGRIDMPRLPLALLLLIFAGNGFSAGRIGVLHLVNGDRVTGLILSQDSSQVVLKTDWNPQLTIPSSLISRKEILQAPIKVTPPSPAPPAIGQMRLKDPAPAITNAPPVAIQPAPPLPVEAKPAPELPVPKPTPTPAPVIVETKPKKKKLKGVWSNDLRLGIDLQYSAIKRAIAHSRLRSSYTLGNIRNLVDLSYSYGKSQGIISADRFTGTIKTDYTPRERWYAYHLGSTGFDLVRRIEYRYQIGPGAGYHLIKGKPLLFEDSKFTLNFESGGEFEDKRATSGISTQKYFWRLAENATWSINDSLTFTEQLEFFPQLGELSNHRYRFESNLAYKLLKNLTLNFTVLAEADPESITDFEPESLQVRSSLGFKF
ncbi:MAG: hypothetical protein CMO80_14625 [Verrucomicrobiales bacterium]|nr:hypothetical protein [Verrucomicrobiales bacterium]